MISVITITFNNYADLRRTLESIRDVPGIESFIVNGGSCVDTAKFLANQDFHSYISEPDGGISDAFNKGARLCKGDYVVYLNSGDIYIGGDYFEAAKRVLDESAEFEFVHSNILLRDKDGDSLMKPITWNLGVGLPGLHPTIVMRKTVFDSIGVFSSDKRIAMDFDLICRMTKAGMQGHYIDGKPVVLMDGDGVSVRNAGRAIRESFESMRDHHALTIQNLMGFLARYGFLCLTKLLSMLRLNWILRALRRRARSRSLS